MQHVMTQLVPYPCLLFQWFINQEQGPVCNGCISSGLSSNPSAQNHDLCFAPFIEQALGLFMSVSLT